jgi:hypothetical protein
VSPLIFVAIADTALALIAAAVLVKVFVISRDILSLRADIVAGRLQHPEVERLTTVIAEIEQFRREDSDNLHRRIEELEKVVIHGARDP